MASLSPSPKMQFFDANGNPLSGGKVYTYAAGTTTPQVSYTDSTGGTPNTNPIILDSRGEANIWLADNLLYAIKLTTSADVLIWTVDNVGGLLTQQVIHAATSKATPVDSDEIPIADSAASFSIKKLTWANLKATIWSSFGALIAAGTAKTVPVSADMVVIADSATANATKMATIGNIFASPPAIGGVTAAAITGTTITANTGFSGPLNGTVGATTPTTGKFTTLQTSGTIGIGIAPATTTGAYVSIGLSGSTSQVGISSVPTFGSDCTVAANGIYSAPSTAAAAFTLPNLYSIRAQGFTKGAGSTITNYYAFYADAEVDATNNYGAYVADPSGFGKLPASNVKLACASADSTSGTFSFIAYNSASSAILGGRGDGLVFTGTNALSPYNNTTASAANVFVDSSGFLFRSTSSIRFKTNVEDMLDVYADAIVYQSRPVFYRSTAGADNQLHSYWGFIAEELALIDPRLVQWGKPLKTYDKTIKETDANGNVTTRIETVTETDQNSPLIPDGVAYERFVVALVQVAKRQKAQLDAQGAAISALQARLTAAGL